MSATVRYVYDRPLPFARHLRIDFLNEDGAVTSSMVSTFEPGKGWVTSTTRLPLATGAA
ncbi:hypothetical protein [Sporichthya polymorpha]|uniref:hypothetical protein n=1 Tax=Sporichthya polymorpha TaxID=35751 RepID=UPI000377D400|nr:hypothetical protein [Sporichthya polymorpha]